MENKTFTLHPGNSVNKDVKTFRYMSAAEVKTLNLSHVFIEGRKGYITVKINGAVKTWKRKPLDFTIPIKYGLYEYSYSKMINGEWFDNPILVEVGND